MRCHIAQDLRATARCRVVKSPGEGCVARALGRPLCRDRFAPSSRGSDPVTEQEAGLHLRRGHNSMRDTTCRRNRSPGLHCDAPRSRSTRTATFVVVCPSTPASMPGDWKHRQQRPDPIWPAAGAGSSLPACCSRGVLIRPDGCGHGHGLEAVSRLSDVREQP